MKKHECAALFIGIILLLLLYWVVPSIDTKAAYSFDEFTGQIECFYPRDWIEGEDDGGTFTVISQPDNGGLTNEEITGDNPCIEVRDCGIFEFQYCVDCPTCSNLTACLPEPIRWCVPCETEFTITCN